MVKVRRAPKPTKVRASSVQSVPPVEKWNKVKNKRSKKNLQLLLSPFQAVLNVGKQ